MKEPLIYLIKGEDRMGREMMAGACEAVEASNHPAMVWAHGRARLELLEAGGVSAVTGILTESIVRDNGLRHLGVPLLNLSNRAGPLPGAGNLLSDDREVGRMAARFLLQKGFTHFLTLTQSDVTVHRERAESFEDEVREAGYPVERVDRSALVQPTREGSDRIPAIQAQHAFYRPYIKDLPLGSGIFSTSDQLAFRFLHCMREEFPEHMDTSGVLGVDDDFSERWGGGGIRGLSSIRPDFRGMGRAALTWLLAHPGESGTLEAPKLLRRFTPRGVVERASTACGGCTDPQTARMVRWLWSRVRQGRQIRIGELADLHGMSLKTLQRRFQDHMGGTAKEMVARFRLDLARDLIRDTTLTFGEISERCGYSKQSGLSRAFQEAEGVSPREWRRGL